MITRRHVFSNFMWQFFERCGAQGVTFVVSLILARLLDPDDYGTVALVSVITGILQVFVDGGLSNALVQKKNADNVDFSTVFFFNIISSVILYAVLFIAAPYIGVYYEMPRIVPIIRVVGLNLIIVGIKSVQTAYVSKNLLFKKFFYSTLGGTIFAAVIGIFMAYQGLGVWALVAQNLCNQIIDTVILWVTVGWRPERKLSIAKFKSLFSFSWKLMISTLLETVYGKLRELVIGILYTSKDLAFYNRGEAFPATFVNVIDSSINSVLLPTMSAYQDNREEVKKITRRAIKTSTFLIMPMMMGMAVCAEPIVRVVLTNKWVPCVIFIRVACFSYAFWPIHTANLNAINALGRSDIYLRLEIVKKVIGLILIFSSMWFGVEAIAYSMVIASLLSQIINAWPNKKLLGYSYIEQMRDILPQISLTIFMGGVVYCVSLLALNKAIILVLQVILGVFIYCLGSVLMHNDSLEYVLSIVKEMLKKGGNIDD